MFTGIVETAASVRERTEQGLVLERPSFFDDIKEGCSVAVAGVCLSVVEFDADSMRFQIVPETWRCTTLGDLKPGDRVNLERSMRADARFEGHVVQGHVEGVADVLAVEAAAQGREVTVRIPAALLPCVVPKGAIALDGVSLTVARLQGDRCTIALIPHTLEVTTFGAREVGERVNVETDIFLRGLANLRGMAAS